MLFTYVLAVSTSSPLLAILSCKTKSRKPTILAVFKGKETFFFQVFGQRRTTGTDCRHSAQLIGYRAPVTY